MSNEVLEEDSRRRWLLWEATEDYLTLVPPELSDIAYRCAVVHFFDAEVVLHLLADDGGAADDEAGNVDRGERRHRAGELYDRLQTLPFVEEYPNGRHNLHSLTRSVVLEHLWQDRREFVVEVSRAAVRYFGRDFEGEIDLEDLVEYVYHLLIVDETEGIGRAGEFANLLAGTSLDSAVHAIASAADEHRAAGRLSAQGAQDVALWRAQVALREERYDEARQLAAELLTGQPGDERSSVSSDAARVVAASYLAVDAYDEAISAYERAREFEDPDDTFEAAENLLGLGRAFLASSRYENALSCLLEAVRLLAFSAQLESNSGKVPHLSFLPENAESWVQYDDGTWGIMPVGTDPDVPEVAASTLRIGVDASFGEIWVTAAHAYEALDKYEQARTAAGLASTIGVQLRQAGVSTRAAALLYRIGRSAGDREMLEAVVEHLGGVAEEAKLSGHLLTELGARQQLAHAQADALDYDSALVNYQEVVRISRDLKDTSAEAEALTYLASVTWTLGDIDRAADLYRRARDLLRHKGYRARAAGVDLEIARIDRARRDFPSAQRHIDEALRMYRDIEDRPGEYEATVQAAELAEYRRDFDQALESRLAAIRLTEAIGSPATTIDAHIGVAALLTRLGRNDAAESHREAAVTMAQQTGNRWKAAELVEAFASDAHVMGDFVRASEHYEEARGLYQELDSPHGVFRVVTGIADAHRDQGKHQESLAAAQETVSIAERLRDPDFMRSALLATALSYDALGDYDNAEKVLQRAQTIGPESPDVLGTLSWHNNEAGAYADALEAAGRALELEPDMAWVMFNQALALLATGNHAAAMDAYRRAAGSSRPDYDATQDLEALKRVIAREQGIPGADEAIELLREVVAGRQRGPAGSAG